MNLELDLEIGGASAPLTGTVEPAAPSTLVTVEPTNIQMVFTDSATRHPLIARITQIVREHKPDVTTAKGRDAIRSLAAKVSRTKTYMDDLGKDLVTRYKELPKKIDAGRLELRNSLDALRDEARKPLDDWEAEQESIKQAEEAKRTAEALALQVEHDHEMALLMNADIDRKREEANLAAEQAQQDREERIRKDAADRARLEAETRAKMEAEASMRRELESKLAQERAEREKGEAEQRTKDVEARAEKDRQESAQREEQARLDATRKEQERQEAHAKAETDARTARERDLEHRRIFNREALDDLKAILAANYTDPAVSILTSIARGQIRHIIISY